jgi:hypothetical protein
MGEWPVSADHHPKYQQQQQQQSAREVRNENAPTAIVSLTFFPFFSYGPGTH